MRVNGRVLTNSFLLFLSSNTGVPPEHINRRIQNLLQVAQCNPSPSKTDFGVIPEQHVNNSGSESSVGCDEIVHVCRGEIRCSSLIYHSIVHSEVWVHNWSLIVLDRSGRVWGLVVEKLGHEREIFGSPNVSIVKCHGEGNTSEITDEAVDQGLKRHPEWWSESSDIIPVKAKWQQSHAFITLGASEEVCEDEIALIGQAENRNRRQKREDILDIIRARNVDQCGWENVPRGTTPSKRFPQIRSRISWISAWSPLWVCAGFPWQSWWVDWWGTSLRWGSPKHCASYLQRHTQWVVKKE